MMEPGDAVKRAVEAYWSRNVPGIDMSGAPVGSEEFYIEVDRHRYRYENYIPPLIHSLAQPGKRVLEVGCGLGTDSREFARQGTQIVSTDLSFDNVARTRRGFETLGLQGRFVTADAEHLPFAAGSFDAVYSFGVLHHTPDTQGAIRELHRVLKREKEGLVMLYHKGLAYYLILLYGLSVAKICGKL